MNTKRKWAMFLAALLILCSVHGTVPVRAVAGITLTVGFADGYDTEQGHVEYQVDGGNWTEIDAASPVDLPPSLTSLKLKVVPARFFEVDFSNGPYLADGVGHSFPAGGAEADREALVGDGFEAVITEGLREVSLTDVAFREAAAEETANLSVSIHGPGLEFWEDDIPSRITFVLPGIEEDIAFGRDNLTWKDGLRPPNATGVHTTSPIEVTYDYDNSGEVPFTVAISNASTKITGFRVNGTDYASQLPQTDEEILRNIADGGRFTVPVDVRVPYAEAYEVEITAEPHDLMGGFGWNYLPEETQSGDAREDCIAHGRLTFVRGEYAGNTYESVDAWRDARYPGGNRIFGWKDGMKEYEDERDAWGEAAFPKGAKITMKLIPDEGYQLVSLYGDENIVPEEEPGVYTITMAGGMNSHLMARFEETGNLVKTNAAAVTGGSVSDLENPYAEGTMKLGVDDTEVNAESRSGFETAAEGESAEIREYLDIHLDNTIYKATANADEAWDRPVSELDNPAQITLELADDYSGKELVVIHEHEGNYEVLPAAYDSATGALTFETDSFSNYAIAEKTEEEDPGKPDGDDPGKQDDPGTEEDPGEPSQKKTTYTIPSGDQVLEFSDREGRTFRLVILDLNKVTDEELAQMGASREELDEVTKLVKGKLPKEVIDSYFIMLLDENGEPAKGPEDYNLKIRITDEMKGYTNLRLYDVSGLVEGGSITGEGIPGEVEGEYLVFAIDGTGIFSLVGTKENTAPEDDSSKKTTPKTAPKTGVTDGSGLYLMTLLAAAFLALIASQKKRRL